ncbi:hypothetical protein [Algoriphagus chordae]|uniref:Uncharacterized protein n=1 Tax=Algoriphagus chordae TaxID=237019 RepID=A0A2W7R831_9BACT|nr:hypothetical protein [Algoriphagus chordae]PZX51897.1 hypothetical protein LV85_02046 [Algoriphagus chordae]
MKFILLTFLTVLLVIVFNPFVPYWVVMIGIMILSVLVGNKGAAAFFAGGIGMGLAWLGQTVYISTLSGSQLPQKMGELMGFGSDLALIAITVVLGFLLGAFSALTGSLLRKHLERKPDNIYGR